MHNSSSMKLGLKISLYNFTSNCSAVHEIYNLLLSRLELFILKNPAFSTLLGDIAGKKKNLRNYLMSNDKDTTLGPDEE